MNFVVFSVLISVAFGQQLLSLSNFKGLNVKNPLKADAPFGIYVSASSDAENLLSNIYVVNADGTQTSLNQLRTRTVLPTSGELQVYTVEKSAYLTTALGDQVMSILQGVMFLSSTSQLKNNNFHVVDISTAHDINLQQFGNVPTTTLFLNTQPNRSSIISEWKQDSTASAYIYSGFPLDTMEPKNSQIFSNPMPTTTVDTFFQNVEKFSLVMVAFYLKTVKGGVNFRIEPGYYSIDKTTTSAFTTTGFYMKELWKNDSVVTVNTRRDARFLGVTGANIVGSLSNVGKVKVGEYDGNSHYEFSSPPNDFIIPWSAPAIGQTFQISSSNGEAGQFYVQYFVQQGINTGTTPLHVETTTSSSGNLSFLISIILVLRFWRGL